MCVYVCVSVCACMRACVRVRASPRHPDRISGLCSHAAHAKSKGSEIKRTGLLVREAVRKAPTVTFDGIGSAPTRLSFLRALNGVTMVMMVTMCVRVRVSERECA